MYLQLELVGPNNSVEDLERRKTVGYKGLTIGRAVGNDWVIADPYVSRRHATISYVDGTFFVQGEGVGYRFAIRRSGQTISVERREALQNHDVLLVDQYEVTVTFVVGDPPLTADWNTSNPSDNQTPPVPNLSAWCFESVVSPRSGRQEARHRSTTATLPAPCPRSPGAQCDRTESH